jgi:hypothetical protein
MDEQRAPGTRATPERWHAAEPAFEAPLTIDWSGTRTEAAMALTREGARVGGDWRERFVADLGRSAEAAAHNSAWRVWAPAGKGLDVALKPRLTGLQA